MLQRDGYYVVRAAGSKGAAGRGFVIETIQFFLVRSVIAFHLHEKRLSVLDGDKIGGAFAPRRTDDIIPIPLQHPFHFPLSSSPQMVASHFLSPPFLRRVWFTQSLLGLATKIGSRLERGSRKRTDSRLPLWVTREQ
jgi:hypothetical protein